MPIPVVDPLPPAPVRNDPNFADTAEVWVQYLADTYTPQLNLFAEGLVEAAAVANYSTVSTTELTISTGTKTLDVETGKMFVAGQFVVIADVAAPSDNWMHAIVTAYDLATGAMSVIVVRAHGSGTIDAWTVGLSAPPTEFTVLVEPVITGTLTEDVYTIVDGAAVDIDPDNGSIQLWTLGANRTPTATNLQNGQSVTLMIADGSAYTVNWSSIAPVWSGGSAPTLPTAGYAVIEVWKVGGAIYMAHVGNVA